MATPGHLSMRPQARLARPFLEVRPEARPRVAQPGFGALGALGDERSERSERNRTGRHFVSALALGALAARAAPRRPFAVQAEAEGEGGVTTKDRLNPSSRLRRAKRFLLASTVVTIGLVLLLYATSFVEMAMHKLFAPPMKAKSPAIACMIGLAVGGLHTVAGPDHLAALAPLVIGKRRTPFAAFGLGALWGSGHATGQLVVGLGCLAVHLGMLKMHWATVLEQMSGLLVGASLIAIGLLGFKEAQDYDPATAAESDAGRFGWATYATGVVHGLSLDAIIFILPAFSLPHFAAVVHVIGVVSGTLFSMGCYTTVLSLFFRKSPRLKLISASASSISLILGVCIIMSLFGVTLPLPGL
ncbi:unnamed protein product [Effrenium voratum]|uniref:Uncharacterized protein n=1 Tax=Effrenium voratum TaxID=2562239 RepID=A0AA36NKJ9_9DINO|nr:unnamed protein product [Effrenium voratum]